MNNTFRVWKSIMLGTHKSQDSLKNDLEKKLFLMDNWVPIIITKPEFTIEREKRKVNLVNVSATDLGFTEYTPLRDIYNQAFKFDLSLCPVEVGPQLRLQYRNQPEGEWFCVASEPIIAPGGYECIFYVGGGGKCFYMLCGNYDNKWKPDDHFLFILRK